MTAQNIDDIECPFCAELIKRKAKICRYCKSQLPAENLEDGADATLSAEVSDTSVIAAEVESSASDLKPCRFCSESIKTSATVCRFCNREQEDSSKIIESDLQKRHGELEQAIKERDFIKAVSLLPQSHYAAYQAEIERRKKNTGIAYLFSLLFVGFYGAQKFYIGEVGWGITYLLCNVLGVFSILLFFISPMFFLVPLICCIFLLVGLFFDLFLIPGQVRKANDRVRTEILDEIAGRMPLGYSTQELSETFAFSKSKRTLPFRFRILGGTLVLLSIIGVGIVAAKWEDLREANTVRDYGPAVESTPTESSATVSDTSPLLTDATNEDTNFQLGPKLSPRGRMIVDHFSNMVEGTDESLRKAYLDFAKDWRQRQSLSKFIESAKKGTWQFRNHLLPEESVSVDKLLDDQHAAVDVEMNFFSPSSDSKLIRFLLVKEGGDWKISKGISLKQIDSEFDNGVKQNLSPSPVPSPSSLKIPSAMPNPFAIPLSSEKEAPSPVAAPISMEKRGAPSASAPKVASAFINQSVPAPIFAGNSDPKISNENEDLAAPHSTRAGGGRISSESKESPSESEMSFSALKKERVLEKPSFKVENNVDFDPYMADLQRRIKRAWFPPKGNEFKKISVVFKVHSNGTMTNLRMLESSNSEVADQAALKAVENSAPFRPLPDGAPAEIDVKFQFDFDALRQGAKTTRRF